MSNREVMKSPFTLEELISPLAPGSRILDLGCGGGTFLYSAFPLLSIHAMDEEVSPKCRDFPSHVCFTRAGASAIPSLDEVFDIVVVNFAFEHFPDPIAALHEIERVAKDRAYVWISIPDARSFEDQLYRNLFDGGGHLQTPTLERFLRWAYENTCLKLVSYFELPAGFTFLGNSDELRHLTWAIIDALKRSVAIEAQAQSGYIFVLRKYAEAGPGFREFLRTCSSCGRPDGARTGAADEQSWPWLCSACGANNASPPSLQAIRMDKVELALKQQWERFPETSPAALRRIIDERGRWGQCLEGTLESERRYAADLQNRYDQLLLESEQKGKWALELEERVKQSQDEILRLKTTSGFLKYSWNRLRNRAGRQP